MYILNLDSSPENADEIEDKESIKTISGLKFLGIKTHLLSPDFPSNHPWSKYSENYLKSNLVDSVNVYQPDRMETFYWYLSKYYRVLNFLNKSIQ